MNEELWNELTASLTPNFTVLSSDEAIPLIKQILTFSNYIKNNSTVNTVQFESQAEIGSKIESLLGRPFNDAVYIYAPELFISVIKARLRDIIENQYKIFYSNHVWFWNPAEGYLVEDYDYNRRIISLVPKTKDLFEKFELKKDSFCDGIFSYRSYLNNLISCFGVKIIDSFIETGKILPALQKITPLTKWGRINWEQIEKKMVLSEDPTKIIPVR